LQLAGVCRFSLACGLKKLVQTRLFFAGPTRVPRFNCVRMDAQVFHCAHSFDQRTKQQCSRKEVSLTDQFTDTERDTDGLRNELSCRLLHRRELPIECALSQSDVDLHRGRNSLV